MSRSINDFQSPLRLIRKTRATKRKRYCDWCGELIPVGNSCYRQAAVFDADFYVSHFHVECSAAKESITYETWREWDHEYLPGSFTRGRTDAEKKPAQFDENGIAAINGIYII